MRGAGAGTGGRLDALRAVTGASGRRSNRAMLRRSGGGGAGSGASSAAHGWRPGGTSSPTPATSGACLPTVPGPHAAGRGSRVAPDWHGLAIEQRDAIPAGDLIPRARRDAGMFELHAKDGPPLLPCHRQRPDELSRPASRHEAPVRALLLCRFLRIIAKYPPSGLKAQYTRVLGLHRRLRPVCADLYPDH